jgi:hypothetical protein
VLFDAASNNRGASNRYWHALPEPSGRFGWNGTKTRLTDFNATPGDEAGTYLTLAQRDAVLSAEGISLSQLPH